MTKLIWCSDIHLDFFAEPGGDDVIRQVLAFPIAREKPDLVILTGDISTAEYITGHLSLLSDIIDAPINFVCGNHDFYGSSVQQVRDSLEDLCSSSNQKLKYLTRSSFVPVTQSTALVGHDGWCDAFHGSPFTSELIMNDWLRITDYTRNGAVKFGSSGMRINRKAILTTARRLATDAAHRVTSSAAAAIEAGYKTVIIATHVPPFTAVHSNGGKGSSPDAQPWYTSMTMGDAITDLAKLHPDVDFNILCGHTHSKIAVSISNNITCYVAEAHYGNPGYNVVQIQ